MDFAAIVVIVMGIAVAGFVTVNFILETFVRK